MKENYLSVKEFAEACGVSHQYIYKLIGKDLKPYVVIFDKIKYIKKEAVSYIKEGFPPLETMQPTATEIVQPTATAPQLELQPNSTENMQLSATNMQLNSTEFMQPTATAKNQPCNQNASCKVASEVAPDRNNELKALTMLIDELKQDKEDLKKDKENLQKDIEYLKQESLKWQQLLVEERNKVKLLEDKKQTAVTEQPLVTEVKEVEEVLEHTAEKPKKKKRFRSLFKK